MKPAVHSAIGTVIALSTLLASPAAFAQGQEGHGGSVVTCFTTERIAQKVAAEIIANRSRVPGKDVLKPYLNDITRVELFDLYLARKELATTPADEIIAAPSPDWKKVLDERMDRIRATYHPFYKSLLVAKQILDDSPWIASDSGVAEISDADPGVTFESNCLLLQLAAQRKIGKTTTDVYFDYRLFNKLKTPLDQAGIHLHEYVYKHLVKTAGAINARATQKIVRTVFKKGFGPSMSLKFAQLLGDLGATPSGLIWTDESGLVYEAAGSGHHLAVNDLDRGLLYREAGTTEANTLSSWFQSGEIHSAGLYYYRYPAPRNYAGRQWLALAFKQLDDGTRYPECGHLADPRFPKIARSACNARLDSQGNVLEIQSELQEDATVGGYSLKKGSGVLLDGELRLIGFQSWPAQVFRLGGSTFKCTEARFDHSAAAGAPTLVDCGQYGEKFAFGNFALDGRIGFRPGNRDLDPARIRGKIEIAGVSLEFNSEPRTGPICVGECAGEYNTSLTGLVFAEDGSNRIVSFQTRRGNNAYSRELVNVRGHQCFGRIDFNADGTPARCEKPLYIRSAAEGLEQMWADPETPARFHPNGVIASYRASRQEQSKRKVRFRGERILPGSLLEFDANGELVRVTAP